MMTAELYALAVICLLGFIAGGLIGISGNLWKIVTLLEKIAGR